MPMGGGGGIFSDVAERRGTVDQGDDDLGQSRHRAGQQNGRTNARGHLGIQFAGAELIGTADAGDHQPTLRLCRETEIYAVKANNLVVFHTGIQFRELGQACGDKTRDEGQETRSAVRIPLLERGTHV